MIKKVLKKYRIPKYGNGTAAAAAQPLIQPLAVTEHKALMMSNALKREYGITGAKSSAKSGIGSGLGGNWGAFGSAATAGGKMLMDAFGVDDNSQAGVTLNSSMQGAEIGGSIVPGWGHLIGGVAGLTLGALKKGSVDKETGDIQYGGIFGRSKGSLMRESNRIKNSLVAKEQTADLQAEWMNNNPNVEMQPAVLAAEGGIMRRPVDALVSKGELIYDPTTKELRKIPGDKGKTNKKDDVPVKLYEGDIVLSNSPTMLMSNGLPPAKNLEMLVDKKDKVSEGTKKAREAIIKKVVNWQEANKTKPQLYAMYGEGDIVKYGYDKNLNNFAYWDKDKKEYKKEYLDFVNGLTDQDVKDIFSGKYGDMSTYKSVNKDYIPTLDEAKWLMTDKKYGDWHKIGAAVKEKMYTLTAKQANKTASKAPDKKEILDETTPGSIPTLHDHVVNNELPRVYGKPKDPPAKTKTTKWTKIDDLAYPLASVLTPSLDREKTEATILRRPTWKGIPVAVDASNELQDSQLGYALTNYNIAQGGYTAGQQLAARSAAASNLARQRAAIHQWQTELQNKNIAQNIASYNDHSNILAEIANKEIDINDANRAAARNINRQNRATALNNWGQIRRDAKQYEMDKLKIAAASPMWKYGMENYDELMKMLNS